MNQAKIRAEFIDPKFKMSGAFSGETYFKHKDQALRLVKERVAYYNKIYKFSFSKISIRNQKTRWGSCSKKKNLSLNYKLLFLPKTFQDYIIVHEICHLKEFNHSRLFWFLVQKTLPDYLEIKKGLKKHKL